MCIFSITLQKKKNKSYKICKIFKKTVKLVKYFKKLVKLVKCRKNK